MNRNSIRWRLPASYAVIALLAALSLGSMMLFVLRGYYTNQERDYLLGNATALQPVIAQILQSDLPEGSLQDQVRGLAFLSQTRIRLLDANERILADSGIPESNQVVAVSAGMPFVGNVMFSMPVDAPQSQGPVLIYRSDESAPGEKQVLTEKSADIIVPVSASPYGYGFGAKTTIADIARRSEERVSVLLLAPDRNKLGVLEFSNGPSYGADVIASVTQAWIFASIFAMLIAALVGWFMSQRVTRPVLALEHATQQMAQGNLAVRVDLPHEKQQEFISLASSFNGMAEQVEQTVSTLRAFIADAAHELHTPLTALQTNLELADEALAPGANPGENVSKRTLYLSRAREQARRLEVLVKSLLDLSRIESVQVNHDFAPLILNQIVNEISEQFASRAEQLDRSFTLDLPDEILTVNGHEMQIKQVLANLLENALKFTPENGTIKLRLDHAGDQAVITINDTGIGISPEDLPHMFERFHRGRNASEYSGNGLGLAIVKAIVEGHSGRVEVQSKGMGEGSTFSVKLPIHH